MRDQEKTSFWLYAGTPATGAVEGAGAGSRGPALGGGPSEKRTAFDVLGAAAKAAETPAKKSRKKT
jgi:hypothetical protein